MALDLHYFQSGERSMSMRDPEDEEDSGVDHGDDEPDMWLYSCDDEWLGYADETDPDDSGERIDRSYR